MPLEIPGLRPREVEETPQEAPFLWDVPNNPFFYDCYAQNVKL